MKGQKARKEDSRQIWVYLGVVFHPVWTEDGRERPVKHLGPSVTICPPMGPSLWSKKHLQPSVRRKITCDHL